MNAISYATAAAPAVLRGSYKEDDWIVIRPERTDEGLAFVAEVLKARLLETKAQQVAHQARMKSTSAEPCAIVNK